MDRRSHRILKNVKAAQLSGNHMPCPRCGFNRMDSNVLHNALSRHADVYICDMCGTDEALRDAIGNALPLTEWGIIRGFNAAEAEQGKRFDLSNINGPWRNDACEGYALIAMQNAGLDKETISNVLRELTLCFDSVSVEDAADAAKQAP